MVIDGQTFDFGIPRIDYPSILKAHSGYCTTKRISFAAMQISNFEEKNYNMPLRNVTKYQVVAYSTTAKEVRHDQYMYGTIVNFSLLQCETCTSSPTTDAFNQGSSSYASLTGVQLTRVVSPVNKRAPSNGGAFAKGESSTEKISRAQKYIDFKNNIPQLFPTIYDTKFLSYELIKILQIQEKWNNSLSGLMSHFTESHGKYIMPGSPIIELTTNSNELNDTVSSKKFHIAGWDAYFAGYLFIRMTHVFATKQYEQGLKEFTHIELMNNIKSFANRVNIVRGNTSYLRFDGPKPKSTRPKWLYVKMLTSKLITLSQVAEKMSKFGMVDVKQYTLKRMLVAVANHGRLVIFVFY
ncbi:Poly(A)-specific ribonuclease PARN-like domain-containing protein 1 [Atta colombica]|uniref:Poly(A)-specific ribonuclease PARN-like domain-containing protein 1 n=1 Tax=Atta colombica TaxID=520822 RepID=A0A195AU53_9HYME|nr:Poly(A)-specific ribonuclease PARN-like domain-containing protein 1 [Atta colombica]